MALALSLLIIGYASCFCFIFFRFFSLSFSHFCFNNPRKAFIVFFYLFIFFNYPRRIDKMPVNFQIYGKKLTAIPFALELKMITTVPSM